MLREKGLQGGSITYWIPTRVLAKNSEEAKMVLLGEATLLAVALSEITRVTCRYTPLKSLAWLNLRFIVVCGTK